MSGASAAFGRKQPGTRLLLELIKVGTAVGR